MAYHSEKEKVRMMEMNYRSLHQMNLYDVFGESPWSQADEFSKDREYMKKFCAQQSRELMPWIEDICDAQEYDGSPMYDEYPDIMSLEKMVAKAYDKAGRPEPEMWVKELMKSLLYNEVCYRRCRRKEFKQRLYPR